jgi:hypothetical protein
MTALRVHNAAIRTASVEMQTITIDGKQVTQSVFRQLRERDVVGEDGRLNGKPWGFVNYHPDKCGGSESHLHVVWQSGADLFRSRVDLEVTFPRWIDVDGDEEWVDRKTPTLPGDPFRSNSEGRLTMFDRPVLRTDDIPASGWRVVLDTDCES